MIRSRRCLFRVEPAGRLHAVIAALLLVALPAAAQTGSRPAFRWGGDAEGGAPFVEADPADPSIVRGFDVEIAEMIAKGLGREPKFIQVTWASIAASVERGDFEIGLSGIEDIPSLRARQALTIPYFEFREVLAVRPGDKDRYRTLKDLAGKRVGTLGSTTAYDILLREQTSSGLVPVSYDDDVHPYDDLVAGRVDAVLLDHVIAERSLRRSSRKFVILPEPVAVGYYVGVLSSRNTALRDSVNEILRERMRDGSLEKTFRKWNVWDDKQAAFLKKSSSQPAQVEKPPVAAPAPAITDTLLTYMPALLRAAWITLSLSCLAMLLAVAVGIGVAAGRVYGPPVVQGLLAVYVEVMRGTPVLLQLYVLY
jgi:polar amino acid transport system substrate-binding protein